MTAALPIDAVLGGVLALVRVFGLLLVAPVFGHRALPMRVRAMLAFGVALVLAPVLPERATAEPALAVVSEFAIGMAIGFAASLVFAAVTLAGELASIQGGLGAAAVLDPSSDASSIVLATLLRTFAILAFLAIDGHHLLLRALARSFEVLPIGSPPALPSFASIAELGALVFETGLRLAAPLTVLMLVVNFVVGVLGRMIPQLNLISLQLPAQVALTLWLLAIGAAAFTDDVARALESGVLRGVEAVLGVH